MRTTAPRRAVRLPAVVLTVAVAAVLSAPSLTVSAAPASNPCPKPDSSGPMYDAPGHGRTVALTFDDGPGPSTEAILKILAAHHVTASFFNIGNQIGADRRLVRREVAAGHAVGNHTWDHGELTSMTEAHQAREIDREIAAQRRATGLPPCMFRPPYGSYDKTTLRLAASRHLSVWMWSVDPTDWKAGGSGSAVWVHRVIVGAEAGLSQRHPVVLLHNNAGGNPATVAALPVIIRAYRSHGYRFVPVFDPKLEAVTA